jgi:hypothetical protein
LRWCSLLTPKTRSRRMRVSGGAGAAACLGLRWKPFHAPTKRDVEAPGACPPPHLAAPFPFLSMSHLYIGCSAVPHAAELDASIFQGRLIHILPGKRAPPPPDASPDGAAEGGEGEGGRRAATSSYKDRKEAELKAGAGNRSAWNTLFMRADTVAAAVAAHYGEPQAAACSACPAARATCTPLLLLLASSVPCSDAWPPFVFPASPCLCPLTPLCCTQLGPGVSKAELLDSQAGDLAVRMALGETQVIAETKRALAEAGGWGVLVGVGGGWVGGGFGGWWGRACVRV